MIYFNGCSYTYGIGTGRHDSLQICKKYCYPTIVSKNLDKEVVNESEQASCNFNIFRKTTKYLSANNPEAVIVMWSDPLRFELFKPGLWNNSHFDCGINQITPQNTQNIKDYYVREALEGYFGFIANESKLALDTLTMMANLQQLCEARNIPILQLHYKSNLERYVRHSMGLDTKHRDNQLLLDHINYYIDYFDTKDHVYGYKPEDMTSFETLRKENNLPNSLFSMGHPGREAHQFMGDWVSNYLKENDFIS